MTLYLGNQKVAPTRTVNNGERYLIEASDETILPSWYRIYSDGWCEQGGYAYIANYYAVEVNFLKPFAHTNYFISVTAKETKNSAYPDYFGVFEISEASMTVMSYSADVELVSDVSVLWEAKGFIDLEEAE